jgi:hypothetical protein
MGALRLQDVLLRERWQVQAAWRNAFAGGRSDWSGSLKEFDWHLFSFDLVEHLRGASAVEAFGRARPGHFIAAESLSNGPMLRCEFAALPAYAAMRSAWPGDLILMNSEFDWTFVMTHEEQFGPYFAERVVLAGFE